MRNNMTEKYRAKRKDNGEWVIGCYIPPAHYFGDGKTHGIERILPNDESGVSIQIDVVDPDTLSRCSGLTACGQEVYEGDIIRFIYDGTAEWWTAVMRFGWHDNGGEYGWWLEPLRDTPFTKRIGVWFGENRLPGVTAAEFVGWIKNEAAAMSDAELMKWMEEKHE